MKIHVLCPFCRVWLLPTLIYYLEPMGIEWYPIVAPKEDIEFGRNWIHPIRVKELEPDKDMSWRKVNDFLDTQEIYDDDYYCCMGDDDMFEPGFFDVIRQQTAKILIISGCLGDSIPRTQDKETLRIRAAVGIKGKIEPHPPGYLRVESLEDVRVCRTGFGQYVMKGELFKQTRYKNNHKWDDGRYGEMLKKRWPEEIKILSDTFIFGNYFQPGRYTDKSKLIKSNWELPRII